MDVILANSQTHFLRSSVLPFELRYSDNSNACYKKHSHPEFSIGVVDSGVSEYINQNLKQEISVGSTVIINPEAVHSCNPKTGTNWSYKMLFVQPDWLTDLQNSISGTEKNEFQLFKQKHSRCSTLYQDFQSLSQVLIENESPLLVEESAITFFSNLILNDLKAPFINIIPKQATHLAYQYISDNVDNNISISEIARESGLSHFYLIHSFKKQYGITPHAYQMMMKINKAKTLLKKGNDIVSIATDLGFTDQSHFHRHFKSIVAATPRQYKKNR